VQFGASDMIQIRLSTCELCHYRHRQDITLLKPVKGITSMHVLWSRIFRK